MNQPETPFESVSYALNQFRERRLADRRFSDRDTSDRRMGEAGLNDDEDEEVGDQFAQDEQDALDRQDQETAPRIVRGEPN
jgi:hypothetical protein